MFSRVEIKKREALCRVSFGDDMEKEMELNLEDIVFALLGFKWLFPKTVKEGIISWMGSSVGEKRRKIWKSMPLCIF